MSKIIKSKKVMNYYEVMKAVYPKLCARDINFVRRVIHSNPEESVRSYREASRSITAKEWVKTGRILLFNTEIDMLIQYQEELNILKYESTETKNS